MYHFQHSYLFSETETSRRLGTSRERGAWRYYLGGHVVDRFVFVQPKQYAPRSQLVPSSLLVSVSENSIYYQLIQRDQLTFLFCIWKYSKHCMCARVLRSLALRIIWSLTQLAL
jgi:hypothetical protein